MPSDAIQFSNIPGTGLVAPIFTAEFNSGGQYTAVDRIILIGHPISTGTMALNTPIPVSSLNQVAQLAGAGSQLYDMARIALRNAPALQLWIMAISDSTLTAFTFIQTVASPTPGVGYFDLHGERIQVAISSADTATTVAAAVVAAVNAYSNPLTGAVLPVTAASTAGVITFTARNKGAIFNEIDIHVPAESANVFAQSGVFVGSAGTAGSGAPTTVAAALAALGDNPADFVVCPFSDSTSLAAYAAWSNDQTGRWAWSRQSYGHVWSAQRGNFAALTTAGLALNDRHLTMFGCMAPGANGTPHPSWLWISAIAARLFPFLTDITYGNISVAFRGLNLVDIKPPRDPSVWQSYMGLNTLNQSGISTFEVAADGTVKISKIITTYQTGTAGQPDAVFRDINAVYQCSEGMKFIRAGLADQFSQKAIANSNPGSLGSLVTPGDIKAAFVGLYSVLCVNGVFQDADTFAQLLKVAINSINPNRVDVFSPMERVNPLDILAINAMIYQQYPDVALLPQAA